VLQTEVHTKIPTERHSSLGESGIRVPYARRQKVYYRLAHQRDASSCWEWESRVIASLDILFRVLWMYRSVPPNRLRVFFSSSVARLDLMLDRENKGLASNSIPVAHLLHGRWSTNQSISQFEMKQFESALKTRDSEWVIETSTIREQDLPEKWSSAPSEGTMGVFDRRRLEIELGTPGDHDTLYTFSLPTSLPQTLAWLKLLARRHHEELQP
jgi:hypothetical protein